MIDKATAVLSSFVAFMLVSNSTVLLPLRWGMMYYAILLAATIYILLSGIVKINMTMIALYVVCILSIVCNEFPDFFKPWPRLGTFAMLTAVVAPTFAGRKAAAFRVQMFSSTLFLLAIVTVISIQMLLTGARYDKGLFHGATVHSMIMGPVAATGMLYCVYQLQYQHRWRWVKWGLIAIIAGSMLCILQTASRAALISAVLAFFAFLVFRDIRRSGKLIKNLCIISLALTLSYPLWQSYTLIMREKNGGEALVLNTDSRKGYWRQRIDEWQSSPIIGMGFSIVEAEKAGESLDIRTGSTETGSSWLSVLSMTGILGFACVAGVFISAVYRAWKLLSHSAPVGAFLLSMMIFFIFHMMAEGYIYAGGNFLNTQIWLLLGTIYSISQYPEYAKILEKKLQLNI